MLVEVFISVNKPIATVEDSSFKARSSSSFLTWLMIVAGAISTIAQVFMPARLFRGIAVISVIITISWSYLHFGLSLCWAWGFLM